MEEIIQLQPINNTYFKNSGDGNSNYNLLENLPQINGVTLKGNKTTSELNINIPTKTSDLTNDSGFITADVNSLVNYYDKDEIDSKLHDETQMIGWSRITSDTYEELDLREIIAAGRTRFTILVYIRKGSIRQGIKYELTGSELEKFLKKVTKNMMCITRICLDPYDGVNMAILKQCVEQVYDGDTAIDGLIKLKYNIYNKNGVAITNTELDNFEWCMYAQ